MKKITCAIFFLSLLSNNLVANETKRYSSIAAVTIYYSSCYKVTLWFPNANSFDPCSNQDGDNDGDGVCNSQDNCRDIWNPNQEDNDGDGIGNYCDDTPFISSELIGMDNDGDGVYNNQDNCRDIWNPNQEDNDGDGIGNYCDDNQQNVNGPGEKLNVCKKVRISAGQGKMMITNIPLGAKLTFLGASTAYADQLLCEKDCAEIENITGLYPGNYILKVHIADQFCMEEYSIKIIGTDGNTPCANQGGDNDGDGVCNNEDNCRDIWNPNQKDNDGDGVGNACDNTRNVSNIIEKINPNKGEITKAN